MSTEDPRRTIPGVDRLLETTGVHALVEQYGRRWTTEVLRQLLEDMRRGDVPVPPSLDGYAGLLDARLIEGDRPSISPVVNATGVVLHTNLGRAPLAEAAKEAMLRASGYSNLEFNLDSGRRGSRYAHCVDAIREVIGGEDALVVNNNAAATALALAAFAGGQDVLVSHGELIEIGGGFRIPEVIEGAGARLRAVGTTNRTRLRDYADALDAGGVGAILKVHRSNFEVSGFTEEAPLEELGALASDRGVPLIYDLGSGLLLPSTDVGLPNEPLAGESLEQGCHLVAVSGDKLLGGPQAGILVGDTERITQLKKHPLCRALRVDKVTLAALEDTLRLYRNPDRALESIPTLRMLALSPDDLRPRAEELASSIQAVLPESLVVEVRDDVSKVGGGTYPGHEIPTVVVAVSGFGSAEEGSRILRLQRPGVVARTRNDAVLLDVRTIGEGEFDIVVNAFRSAFSG